VGQLAIDGHLALVDGRLVLDGVTALGAVTTRV
jgi:hypothetical protein